MREEGTGMADEQAYVGKLVTAQEAHAHLAYDPFLQKVVEVAVERWQATQAYLASRQQDAQRVGNTGSTSVGSANTNAAATSSRGRFSGLFRRSSSVG